MFETACLRYRSVAVEPCSSLCVVLVRGVTEIGLTLSGVLLLKETFYLTNNTAVFLSSLFFFFGCVGCFPRFIRLVTCVSNCKVAHVGSSKVIYI